MPTIKHLIIAIPVGLIGYEFNQFFLHDGLQLPLSAADLTELLIFIAVAVSGTFFAGETAASGDDREEGTVKWFNSRKGYGFITRDQGEDIFVHFNNIKGSGRKAIHEGERVSFVVISSDKGPQADQVKVA